MRISVLGGGHAATALAAHLTLHQHRVHLAAIPSHPGFTASAALRDGVMVEAVADESHQGIFARIDRLDTDVNAAIESADVIILSLPATAREEYFAAIATHAHTGTLVFIQPDKYGALRLAAMMREVGREPSDLLICGSDTFLFIAKVHDGNHVWLRGRKSELRVAAVDPARTAEAVALLKPLYPEIVAARSVFHTCLDSSSSSLHPATVIFNMAHIENRGAQPCDNYDVSPGMGAMIDAVDAERLAVASAFGIEASAFTDIWGRYYGLVANNAYDLIRSSSCHRGQILPSATNHRYVSEDVPHGLVPLLELGELAGVPIPATQALITIASTVNGVDYRDSGRTLESMGLSGMSVDDLRSLISVPTVETEAAA